MNAREEIDLDEIEDSWAHSVTEDLEKSTRRAWIVALVAGAIALLEALALVWLMPLKEIEPYTLLVDRQTGHVEALAPLDASKIAPDTALTRSFLVQYVIARESFDADNLQDDYRKVTLWTEGVERKRYIAMMRANNPASPLSFMPRGGRIAVEVRSVTSLGPGRSLIRFTTRRSDKGGGSEQLDYWAAVIDYTFSNAEMSDEDRFINPLGFQVTRYRRDAERLPEIDAARGAEINSREMRRQRESTR